MSLIRWGILKAEDAAGEITVRKFYDDISFQIIRNAIIIMRVSCKHVYCIQYTVYTRLLFTSDVHRSAIFSLY